MLGVSIIKSEVYNCLKSARLEDGSLSRRYCHFPEYDPEYFQQLTAEQLVTKIVKGYPHREWQKIRDRNEALDCRVYARAAAISLGLDHWSDRKWEQITGFSEKGKYSEQTTHSTTDIQTIRKKPRVVRSKWM